MFNLIAKLNSYDRPLKVEDVIEVFGFSKTKIYRMSESKQISVTPLVQVPPFTARVSLARIRDFFLSRFAPFYGVRTGAMAAVETRAKRNLFTRH